MGLFGFFKRKKKIEEPPKTEKKATGGPPKTGWVKIVPGQVFLHGTDRYEPGVTYEVDPALAAYFAAAGWLEGSERTNEEVDLSIDNATLGHQGGLD